LRVRPWPTWNRTHVQPGFSVSFHHYVEGVHGNLLQDFCQEKHPSNRCEDEPAERRKLPRRPPALVFQIARVLRTTLPDRAGLRRSQSDPRRSGRTKIQGRRVQTLRTGRANGSTGGILIRTRVSIYKGDHAK
jgi:hypothetical protein